MGKRTTRSRNGKPSAAELGAEHNYQDAAEVKEKDKGSDSEQGNGKKVFNPKRNYPKNVISKDQGTPMSTKFGVNDDNFWIANNALVEDSSKVSLFTTTGKPFNNPFQLEQPPTDSPAKVRFLARSAVNIPGIMNFHVMPIPGELRDSTDPFNKGLNIIFEFMQRLTGRNPDYDPNMLGIYFLAHESAYIWWAVLTRVYGVMKHWEFTNDYTPEAIVKSLGFDFQSLKRHRAEFLATINQYAFELSCLPMPSVYKFITRHQRLFEAIYTDSDGNAKAQYYIFQPDFLWTLEEGSTGNPNLLTQLTAFHLPRAYGQDSSYVGSVPRWKFEDIQNVCDELLQKLRNSQDMRMIKADILKSFGDDLVTIAPIDVDYSVSPIYNEEMLEQIENAYIYGIGDDYTMSLEQNVDLSQGGGLVSNYKMSRYDKYQLLGSSSSSSGIDLSYDLLQAVQNTNAIVNFHRAGEIEAVKVMHATRFTGLGLRGAVRTADTTSQPFNPVNCIYTGFHGNVFDIISCATVTWWNSYLAQDGNWMPAATVCKPFASILCEGVTTLEESATGTTAGIANAIRAAISKFDWHPGFRIMTASTKATDPLRVWLSDLVEDLDNWGLIGESQLSLMNKAAQLSVYTPTGLGGYSPNQD